MKVTFNYQSLLQDASAMSEVSSYRSTYRRFSNNKTPIKKDKIAKNKVDEISATATAIKPIMSGEERRNYHLQQGYQNMEKVVNFISLKLNNVNDFASQLASNTFNSELTSSISNSRNLDVSRTNSNFGTNRKSENLFQIEEKVVRNVFDIKGKGEIKQSLAKAHLVSDNSLDEINTSSIGVSARFDTVDFATGNDYDCGYVDTQEMDDNIAFFDLRRYNPAVTNESEF